MSDRDGQDRSGQKRNGQGIDIERRYKEIFELAPVSLWEWDYSAVVAAIESLKVEGIRDLRAHFADHPEVVGELVALAKIINVNRASLAMFGAECKEQLLGSIDRVFVPETYALFRDQMMALADGESNFAGEAFADTLTGTRLYVYLTLTVLPPRDRVTTVLVTIWDISRRKKAEDELAAQEMLYRTLTESIPHLVWMGDSQGKITYCNRAMCEATGISLDQARGRDWIETVHPDDRDKILAIRQRAQEQRNSYRGEYKFRAADDSHRTVSFIDTPVTDRSGEVVSWVGINTDISQLKETQEQLQSALERPNRELSQITHVASHDLQEPLRMVASYAQLLKHRYAEKLDQKADKYIGYLVEGAVRIRQLIRDLLAFSNVSIEGKEPVETDSGRVVSAVISRMEKEIAETGATITRDPLPDVLADQGQMVKLFHNLLGNSLKFRSGEAPRIHISARRDGAMCLFSVKDNGKGFDSEVYGERVFEMFQRLQTRDQYPGTGIGLTIAQKIVERHGGRIWVVSHPESGATFFFTLPAVGVEIIAGEPDE
ncbi:MAG: PAS domain S-box protein [Proteobacteria bacterium]|nr:PAS domain S-box protein [Pseudomonadota bacterium]